MLGTWFDDVDELFGDDNLCAAVLYGDW